MLEIANARQRRPQTNISNKTMQFQVFQFILYIDRVVLIPQQNMFTLFPHISELENTDYVKD